MSARVAFAAAALALLALAGSAQPQTSPVADPAAPALPGDARAEAPLDSSAAATQADAPALPDDPRARYNAALAMLEGGAPERAAAAFLSARDAAGPDAALRYRAAFNLGVALATQADAAADAKPEATLETLSGSAAWFRDAVRLAPEGDDDARFNLEVVLRRIEQLADRINRNKGLAGRLDRIIDDQRGLRDGVRGVLGAASGAGATPAGSRSEFEALAVRERALLAEASAVADLAAAEGARLNNLGAEANAEQRGRRAQLEAMDHYLQRSRQSLGDARRRLRRLEGERAHRRADAALAELKRAREQLQDPATTLQAILRDERELIGHTGALATFADGAPREGAAPASPPAWLTTRLLVNRQEDAAARTGETLRRLEAAAAAPESTANAPEAAASPPAAQRLREAATQALPHLREGLDAMRSAIAALENEALVEAVAQERLAARALARAIERFADLRALIELAWSDQAGAVALLEPPAATASETAEITPAAQRVDAAATLAANNRERLERMASMLKDMQDAAAPAAAGEAPDNGEAAAEAAALERLARAESLRAAALAELETLARTVSESQPSAARALPPAQAALDRLAALRRLFFSIVEHLQALAAEQSDTHDRAATLQFESRADRLAPELGLVAQRQSDHANLADALAQALERQADAAATEAAPAQPNGVDAQALAAAAEAVRAGAGNMHAANAIMAAALSAAASSSPDLEPALDEQIAAVERLQEALRLLQPPREGEDQDGAAAAQAANAQQAEPPAEEEERMSQRQALRRLQAIRDRDAQRRRERGQSAGQPDPVEKDW